MAFIATNFFTKNIYSFYSTKPHFKVKNNQLIYDELRKINSHFNYFFQKQTHSDNIQIITKNTITNEFSDTDALITNQPKQMLLVYTADCAPILLHNQDKNVIAAIHAGWKGTAKNIVGKTLQKMVAVFNCNHAYTKAFIGPCISQENYEVGAEVYDAFLRTSPDLSKAFLPAQSPQKYLCNIKEANKILLQKSGVLASHIKVSDKCTFSDVDHLYSARREGINTGRMVSGIAII